jgi:hypothetical protein
VTEIQTTAGGLPSTQALIDTNARRSSGIRRRSCPGID